jgi:hypothetical protein
MPNIEASIAVNVARLFVFHPPVERLAFVGPLFRAIAAYDDAPITAIRSVGGSHERRPVRRTLAVTGRLAGGLIIIERIEGQTGGVDQRLAFRRLGDFGRRRRLREYDRCTERQKDGRCGYRNRLFHGLTSLVLSRMTERAAAYARRSDSRSSGQARINNFPVIYAKTVARCSLR